MSHVPIISIVSFHINAYFFNKSFLYEEFNSTCLIPFVRFLSHAATISIVSLYTNIQFLNESFLIEELNSTWPYPFCKASMSHAPTISIVILHSNTCITKPVDTRSSTVLGLIPFARLPRVMPRPSLLLVSI
jgi:hypothetical protein